MSSFLERKAALEGDITSLTKRIKVLLLDAPSVANQVIEQIAEPQLLSAADVTPTLHSFSDLQKNKNGQLPIEFEGKKVAVESYLSSQKEIIELRAFLEKMGIQDLVTATGKTVSVQKVRTLIGDSIYKRTTGVTKKSIELLLNHPDFLTDIVAFYKQVIAITGGIDAKDEEAWKNALLEQAVVVVNPSSEKNSLQVSHEAFRLLFTSRMLGLFPKKVLDKLQTMPIKVLGASAAMPAIRLLMLLGAENITFVDDGLVDNNKNSMLQADGYEMNGQYKAVALLRQLYGYNPFAQFRGILGRAVSDEATKRSGHEDITFAELLEHGDQQAGLLLEVVDDASVKVGLRAWLEVRSDRYKDLLFGWLADTHIPFAGLEKIGAGNPFNANFNGAEKVALEEHAGMLGTLRTFWMILKKSFPTEHKQMFMAVAAGFLPFLSQTPLAAQESSALLTRLLLRKLTEEVYQQESTVEGTNLTATEAPTTFIPEYTEAQIKTLKAIMTQVLELPAAQ